MSKQVLIPILQAGGTAAELASLNPIGFERQLVVETDTLKAKLLDGVTHYNDLPYFVSPGSSPLTTKGDLYTFGATNSRLPVGSDGMVLMADSTQSLGLKWSALSISNISGLQTALDAKQATLVSGTNIKTINGTSILGAGDLIVGGAVDSVNGFTGVVVLDTGDIADTTDYRYVTDAQLTVLSNTSGVNTGDQDLSPYLTIASAASTYLTIANAASTYLALSGGTLTGDLSLATLKASGSGGLTIKSNNDTNIGLLGAGNTANVTWYGSHNFDTATQDTIAAFTGSGKTLGSLALATYPSLTELSYVKGVTSAIQTQLNAKLTTAAAASTYVPYTGASSAVDLGANNLTVNTNTFFVDAANNRVGIGTASLTSYSLTIYGSTYSYITLNNSASGISDVRGFQFGLESTGDANLLLRENGKLGLWTNNTIRMTITEAGLVALGNGITSSYPALKRSGTELQIRLADDSGYGGIDAGTYKVGGVAGYNGTVGYTDNGGAAKTMTFTHGILTSIA